MDIEETASSNFSNNKSFNKTVISSSSIGAKLNNFSHVDDNIFKFIDILTRLYKFYIEDNNKEKFNKILAQLTRRSDIKVTKVNLVYTYKKLI